MEQDAWLPISRSIRFRGFVTNYPYHGFPPWLILHTFCVGLCPSNRKQLNNTSEGAFSEYSLHKAWDLLESIHLEKESYYDI
jgi:hypothetical protein